MRPFLLLLLVGLAISPAFPQAIASTVYSWEHAPVVKQTGYEVRTLLEGTTRDFSHLIVQATTLLAHQPSQPAQELDEEALLVIKSGELSLTLAGKRKTVGPGSVVLIMPGDEYRIENKANQPLTYYLMRYTSNEMPDLDLYRLAGGSFWVDGQEVSATADHRGGVRQLFAGGSVMSSRVVMQVTTLDAGLRRQPPHTHRAAEIVIILNHAAQANIGGASVGAQVGDVIFVESDVSHSIDNSHIDGITYLSLQF